MVRIITILHGILREKFLGGTNQWMFLEGTDSEEIKG